jgi:fatty acid-binding protein DegV
VATSQRKKDRTDEVVAGLHQLVEAGRIEDVEAVLTTLIESEPAGEPSVEERETRSYAEGMRDGLALARRAQEQA